MHKTILITLCCLQVWALNAQISDLRGGGAFLAGQARMSSVLHADDALFGNIAAMPFSNNKYMIDASGERRFGFEDLSLYNLGGVYQFGNAAVGFQLVDFGDIDYKERKFQASYAMQLAEAFSMGVSFNFLQLSIAEYGQSFTPTIDFGIFTRVLPDIHVGAHVQNLLQANKETVSYPSVLTLGASYSASDKVDFKIEAEKILDRSLAVKAGIVYTPVPGLSAYLGADSRRESIALALSYQFSSFKLGGAYSAGTRLGSTPAISLRYFKPKTSGQRRSR